ncbi:alcohol oxidase [Xylaria bambusicola]|uniref:alcohol oxidase n=1 Tax=Xylaria bambusicola TaxID=326684 RepID=UPI00200801E2|nr:alcohol oxidase [Xylaria bambusicola]KAI0502779.1 alcohol oxidase [Xylaria bambusicola]
MALSPLLLTSWDYIFVGGGLSASVVAHRLNERDQQLKILVVEAGPDANNAADIVYPNSTNLIGGEYDWKYITINQTNLDDRTVNYPAGKALGGGTVINRSGWVRGDKFDLDQWGELVGDTRWSYDGMLPYIRKTEKFWSDTINTEQHGLTGLASIQSETSTNRKYPMREYVRRSWNDLGIEARPGLDSNAGDPLGMGEVQENRVNGRREIAAAIYSLHNVTVLTETLVEKVLFKKTRDGLSAIGIKLRNGTEIHGQEVILSAGAIRSPQILMLSGVGPADELEKFNIPVLLDQPAVGANLADHGLFAHSWKLKDPSAGWCPGSGNPLFQQPQYGWGTAADFIVSTDVPKDGLAAAIAADEGVDPDPATHPLLRRRTFAEHLFMYGGSANGSVVSWGLISLLATSRGSVKLSSASIQDPPLIDPNFLGTAVDRYVARESLKLQIQFAGSNKTVVGRDIIAREVGAPGFSKVLSVDSTDAEIDARLRAGMGTSYHPMGSLAMGSVVDTDLKVRGIQHLRVVDTSVFPVVPTGHLQVTTYAMAEQAAVIIYEGRSTPNKTVCQPT